MPTLDVTRHVTNYAEAKAELGKIIRQLERVNPSARSLAEGMEETLTMRRLGVGESLRAAWRHGVADSRS